MCLYEHQSTLCPNMPLRGLFYISELYQRLQNDKKLYSATLVKIPAPHYIVFYNGLKNIEDIKVQKLSDAFFNTDKESCIEVTATLININYGHNKELMESCQTLMDYSYFVARIRYHMGKTKAKSKAEKYSAVNMAVNECISQNILADFLKKNKAEVMDMSIYEYDEEEAKEVFREDGRIEGRAEGLAEGFSKGLLEAKITDILELLEDLGEIPLSLKSKIYSQTNMDILKTWHKTAAKSNSISEFERTIS